MTQVARIVRGQRRRPVAVAAPHAMKFILVMRSSERRLVEPFE